MKIRHNGIDAHLTSDDNIDAFGSMMAHMVQLYASCPDASKIRFIQAIEDQFKSHAPARGRTSGGSSTGSAWRNEQKAQFAGRGSKWVKLTGKLHEMVLNELAIYESEGTDIQNYKGWTDKAGYAWVRYNGPRGTEDSPELAFEIRIRGSKIDHPRHLLRVSVENWNKFEENREELGGTPFSMSLEN